MPIELMYFSLLCVVFNVVNLFPSGLFQLGS